MEFSFEGYDIPEGCVARAVVQTRRVNGPSGMSESLHETTITVVCGERSFDVTDAAIVEHAPTTPTSLKKVSEDCAYLLGAMCIGCPNKTTA